VTGAREMIDRLIGEDVSLEVEIAPGVWPVKADSGQVDQILVNLAVNARDAMPEGGTLRMAVANQTCDRLPCPQCGGTLTGDHVRLDVSDTGVGMDPETVKLAFEPFFSTKEKDRGTGLGLAVVLGAVQQNRAHVMVFSEPAHGTTFSLFFRRVDGSPETTDHGDGTTLPTGLETILLAEDEPLVRQLATRVLERFGYTVLTAANGRDALAVAEAHADGIDLLLSDVVMPGMNGRELYERLVADRPGLRVLYVSGYPEEVIARRGILEPGVELVRKPFTASALARRVRQVLDRVD
jgi:CheY-like chemotaxis protein